MDCPCSGGSEANREEEENRNIYGININSM